MQNVTRRSLLSSGAVGLGALAVAGCTTNPATGQFELDPTVIDAIQSGVAKVAQYLPTVESIVSEAVSLFGPAYAAIVQIGSGALNALIASLASIVGGLTPPASAALRARLRGATSPATAVVIGTTATGVVVSGYR